MSTTPSDNVVVVPYNPFWIIDYRMEAKSLQAIFEPNLYSINHIGSTAIPTIYAKPVIDIAIQVFNIDDIVKASEELDHAGYIPFPLLGQYGWRGFRKRLLDGEGFNLHIFLKDHPVFAQQIAFRNYIVNNPKLIKMYSKLKRDLPTDIHVT